MARRQKEEILSKMDPRDIMAVDRVFSALRNEGVNVISGWSNTRYTQINEWQREENRQLSEQRGLLILKLFYFQRFHGAIYWPCS